jgi:hypothetical protein
MFQARNYGDYFSSLAVLILVPVCMLSVKIYFRNRFKRESDEEASQLLVPPDIVVTT